MTLKIRSAHPGDGAELTSLMERAKQSWGHDAASMERFRASVRISPEDPESGDILVAEIDGLPIGFAAGSNDGACYRIDYLVVDPEFSRKGIGRLLLTRLTDIARASTARRLTLESAPFTNGFYEKNGFQRVGTSTGQMAPADTPFEMEKQLGFDIMPLQHIDIRLERSVPWTFELEHRDAIERYWKELLGRNPHLWNGTILKLTSLDLSNGILKGSCRECSFAAFLAWRDWGAPDLQTFNIFGSAILRSADGALLYGVMADHTANKGKIYPPGGNLDLGDVAEDDRIDVEGSTYRELEEETGLGRRDVTSGQIYAVLDGPRLSIARVVDSDRPAEELREQIIRHSMQSTEQELADVRLIRDLDDLQDQNIMPYARALARHVLNLPHPT